MDTKRYDVDIRYRKTYTVNCGVGNASELYEELSRKFYENIDDVTVVFSFDHVDVEIDNISDMHDPKMQLYSDKFYDTVRQLKEKYTIKQ
jgi:hypothetical protein